MSIVLSLRSGTIDNSLRAAYTLGNTGQSWIVAKVDKAKQAGRLQASGESTAFLGSSDPSVLIAPSASPLPDTATRPVAHTTTSQVKVEAALQDVAACVDVLQNELAHSERLAIGILRRKFGVVTCTFNAFVRLVDVVRGKSVAELWVFGVHPRLNAIASKAIAPLASVLGWLMDVDRERSDAVGLARLDRSIDGVFWIRKGSGATVPESCSVRSARQAACRHRVHRGHYPAEKGKIFCGPHSEAVRSEN